MTATLAVVRWFHAISLMLLFGGAALAALARLTPPWAGLRWSAVLVAVCGGLLWFCLTAAQMGGAATGDVFWRALTQTLFGQVFAARLGLLLLVCAGLWRNWRESILALLCSAALALISVTSHAAEASPAHFTAIGILSDGLHLLTGGFWIGGLAALLLLFARNDENFSRVTGLFAEWGMIAVTVLILTGMLNAATILLETEGHDAPLYLRILGFKLALVLAMVGLAVFNHVRLLPRLAEPGRKKTLGRNIRLELVLGLAVVALASLLSLLPPTF